MRERKENINEKRILIMENNKEEQLNDKQLKEVSGGLASKL